MIGRNGGTLNPWEKGQSGNKKGKKKGTLNRSTIARQWLSVEQKTTNLITSKEELLSQEEIITLAVIKKAREGNLTAYKVLMDSAYGQPTQQIEQTNTEIDLTDLTIEELKDLLGENE